MQKVVAVVLMLFVATAAFAESSVDAVRDAETAFAKAFADRDQDKFFKFVLDDATFLAAKSLSGKKAVIERWSRFFAAPVAPFSWAPERVAVNATATIGISTGPVYDAKAHHIGNYSSVWVKQQDGTWKVLFDGPGSQPACIAETAEPFAEGDIVTDDGVKLHYRKIGSAPTTIIVPYGAMFEDFRALADVATVIAYDPRNRGRSQTLSDLSSLSMQREVDDFEAVRAHFNADRVIPVGWSYLGAMVALYASQHPEHVSRLVQIGPIGRSASLKFEAHTDAVSIPPSADKCEAAWQNLANRLVGDPSHASRLRSTCDQPNESEEHLAGHFAKLWPSIEQTEFTAVQIAKITMPLLTIHGTWDRNAAYGYGRDWAQSLPNARLLTVPHAAHAVWVDDPALVFGAIRQFLRGEWPLTAEKVTLD